MTDLTDEQIEDLRGIAAAMNDHPRSAQILVEIANTLTALKEQLATASEGMPDTPNIDAAIQGSVSGKLGEWPQLRVELIALRAFVLTQATKIKELEEKLSIEQERGTMPWVQIIEKRAEEAERKLASAREETIEECAKVSEAQRNVWHDSIVHTSVCAAAIRALKGGKP